MRRLRWLPLIVLVVNLAAVGLMRVYTWLNLMPSIAAQAAPARMSASLVVLGLAAVLPAVATTIFLWPVLRCARQGEAAAPACSEAVPAVVVERAANAPLALGLFSLLGWLLVTLPIAIHVPRLVGSPTLGTWAHFFVRPLLAGLIAAVAVYFAAEAACRQYAWPLLLAGRAGEAGARILKIRVAHRHLLLWLAISFLPLGVVALIAIVRLDAPDLRRDPVSGRLLAAVVFIAVSSAAGGAGLAWLMSRSMDRPLRRLEAAMLRLRAGDFDVRLAVSGPDEIGSLEAGFNQTAERLRESYAALETRNRELAEALDRVRFLASVKRGLDRFVPDTVRRLIEADPETSLAKVPRDVTVLFLDIEGYTHLSEVLPREALTDLVERYFSDYLSDIRAGGGDITETAGDGLMILFAREEPEPHAVSAVRVALAIRARTVAANRRAGPGAPAISVNMGLDSGSCDVGSTRLTGPGGDRWTYTATGPTTNVAARLCGHARHGQVLIGGETARRVRGRFRLRSLGPLVLKNVGAPVEACEAEGEEAPAGAAHATGTEPAGVGP